MQTHALSRSRVLTPLLALALVVLAGLACSASPAFASFGFQPNSFESLFLNGPGVPAVQAGSHPAEAVTSFKFNTKEAFRGQLIPDGDVKDVEVELPAGLVGNATAMPKCTFEQFTTQNKHIAFGLSGASCPNDSEVGVARVEIVPSGEGTPVPLVLGVYNLVAPPGVPAEFGVNPIGIPVIFAGKVRTGKDYGISIVSRETNQGQRIYGVRTVFWGDPADSSHDGERGECLGALGEPFALGEGHPCPVEVPRKPFISLPTRCQAGPLTTSIYADSWQDPAPSEELATLQPPQIIKAEAFNHDGEGHPAGVSGCEHVPFTPSLSVQPDTAAAESPSGLDVNLGLPQPEAPESISESDLKEAVVQLPAGISVSPSAANGLGACPLLRGAEHEAQEARRELSGINLESTQPANCPPASQVGTVEVQTPLLEAPMKGAMYIAQQGNLPGAGANAFGSLMALYLVAEGDGVVVKLTGEVTLNSETGQLTARFGRDPIRSASTGEPQFLPQLPFSDLRMTLSGGPRAPLATPAACGTYTTSSELVPWSGGPAVSSPSSFTISSGPNGGPCPSSVLPFTPAFTAGTHISRAGGFSSFTTVLSRSDGEQRFSGVSVKLPPGLAGILAGVPACGEAQANAGTCPAASRIGHVTATAGVGSDPVRLPEAGKPQDPVYLTGPYKGAPFGLSIVVPAEAGPFNLDENGKPVVVRARIIVDPATAQVSVISDPLPTILQGVPTDVKSIIVTIDRPGFTFNPTSCEPMAITGTITSTQGATAAVSSPFQAASCASLKFGPSFTVSTSSHTSKADGASLSVRLSYPSGSLGSQANIKSVRVELPKALPSRLTTLQQACTAAQFAQNPAGCPAASVVGHAIVHTQLLPVPLEGPAYFVSHGGEAFPNLVMVLQGDGVTVELVGDTLIRDGITSTTFPTTPDVPFESFELELPQGQYSSLAANGNLCQQKLVMPTAFVAQNGATLNQNTPIEVEGCPNALTIVSKKIKGKTLTLKVAVPSGGKLTVSGKGLSSTTKTANSRGMLTVTVHQKQGGKLKTKVKLKFTPSVGKSQSKTLAIALTK